MELSVNGAALAGLRGVKEVDPNLTIKEAQQITKDNGINELYFKLEDKTYIAYGDSLDLKAFKKGDPVVKLDGKTVEFFPPDEETISAFGGAKSGAIEGLKSTRDIVNSAVNFTARSLGVGGVVAAGGAITVTGIAVAKGATMSSGAMGNIVKDVFTSSSITALKGIGITIAGGLAVAVGTGAITGALDASSKKRDYSTITSVTKEGNFKPADVQKPSDPPLTPPTEDPKPADNSRKLSVKAVAVKAMPSK